MSFSESGESARFAPKVICADIGSIRTSRFAWWQSPEEQGTCPKSLATQVTNLLIEGHPVALGFECPLYVPLPKRGCDLGRSRVGERGRAWNAGAGCGALATGLVQIAWVLREIRTPLLPPCRAHLDWESFSDSRSGLFLWEAFVSNKPRKSKAEKASERHPAEDLKDAESAVAAFRRHLYNPQATFHPGPEAEAYSLVGAALLRTGWSEDIGLLKQSCLVVSDKE